MEQVGAATPSVVSRIERQPNTVERRSDKRHLTVLRVGKIMSGAHEELCMIRNISSGGLMAHIYCSHEMGEQVSIEIKNGHVMSGRIVWTEGFMVGIEFDERIDVLHFLANEQTDLLLGKVPRAPRLRAQTAVVVRRGAHYVHAEIEDISQGGAKVSEGNAFDADDDVVLMVHGLPPRHGTVRWRKNGQAGISFNEPIPFEALAQWIARQGQREGAAN